jgi:hypothetical protein
MEPEGLLLCSQEPATCPYPEPEESIPHPAPCFRNINFNIVLPYTPRTSKWSLPFKHSNQNFVRISHLPVRYMTRLSQPHLNVNMWSVLLRLKGKVIPLHTLHAHGVRGGEVQLLLILNLGTRWGWVVSITPRPRFTPRERAPGTH